jgi:hypothetical protein
MQPVAKPLHVRRSAPRRSVASTSTLHQFREQLSSAQTRQDLRTARYGPKVEAAYRHDDALEKRRGLLLNGAAIIKEPPLPFRITGMGAHLFETMARAEAPPPCAEDYGLGYAKALISETKTSL